MTKTVSTCGAAAGRAAIAAVLACAIATTAATPRSAGAQVTAAVPLEARAYDALDQLSGAGYLPTMIVGQRPYSRLEVGRLAAEARVLLDAEVERRKAGGSASLPSGLARLARIVAGLEAEYGSERGALAPSVARLDGAAIEGLLLDSPGRPISDVGLGAIDAAVNPLAQHLGGRAVSDGTTGWVEAAGSGSLGGFLAANAHGGAIVRSGAHNDRSDLTLRGLSATLGARNIVIQAGRQQLLVGQGMHGGLFTSRNAPALDMVRIGTDVPARLPWLLSRLGPARGSIFIADLGADQFFAHEKLVGWKMSFLPSRRFELGMSLLSQQGGEGAPSAEWHERVIDVFTIVDVLFLQERDLIFSNKLAGLDMRLRLPRTEVYLEIMSDDFDVRRVGSSLWEDTGYLAGVVLPALGVDGSWRIDAEYQHTGLRFYQHGQFQSGVTARGFILGLPLGPRGDALTARAGWGAAGGAEVWASTAMERRSDDRYVTAYGENDEGFRFVMTADLPEEHRVRGVVGASWPVFDETGRFEAEAGVERVTTDGFVRGASRVNSMARLGFVLGFR